MIKGSKLHIVACSDEDTSDSKTLTEEERERLFRLIKAQAELGWHVDIISPETISDKMLRTLEKPYFKE